MQIRLSIKYLAGNRSVIRSLQHTFFTRLGIGVKLFYKNGESTTVTLQKFRSEKELKVQKNPISLNEILNLV